MASRGVSLLLSAVLVLGSLVLGSLVLAGCAQLAGPRSVVYSEAELQQMLDRKFPMERRVLEVVDVQVSSPRVTLYPDRRRLSLALQVDATDRLFASVLHGRLTVEGGLRLEPSDASIRLSQARVTSFSLEKDGKDAVSSRVPVQRIGSLLAEKLLDDVVIHQLRPEQMERLTRAGYRPGTIEITPAGIVISVVPAH